MNFLIIVILKFLENACIEIYLSKKLFNLMKNSHVKLSSMNFYVFNINFVKEIYYLN